MTYTEGKEQSEILKANGHYNRVVASTAQKACIVTSHCEFLATIAQVEAYKTSKR